MGSQPSETRLGLESDPRWQLIQRIVTSRPFQKSTKVRDLLLHIAEHTIHGRVETLTEQQIGRDVFGKPLHYTPTEDSSVRVHARQLRLKLHEYFDGPGREEPLVVEIPRGAYLPVFHEPGALLLNGRPDLGSGGRRTFRNLFPWVLSGILASTSFVLSHRLYNERGTTQESQLAARVAWPLSRVLDGRQTTYLILADANFAALRFLTGRRGSLEDYLSPDFQQKVAPLNPTARESKMLSYLFGSTLTSYANVANVRAILEGAGTLNEKVVVRSARELRVRDISKGHFILSGSQIANPWVSIFEKRLNFHVREDEVGGPGKYFLNRSPRPGELKVYRGLKWTGSTGLTYATLCIFPNAEGSGNISILQGLEQEGTEVAGAFLAKTDNQARLRTALSKLTAQPEQAWFEVLIQTKVIAGAPSESEIAAARLIE